MAKKIMETKLYIRDGKRFKYVPNMLGMYWNDIILTKEKMQDSIAIVIEQHYDHVVMASLETSERMSWYKAKVWCKNKFDSKGKIPSRKELISLSNYINLNSPIWGEEFSESPDYAWELDWNGGVTVENRNGWCFRRAIAVTDVSILNLI